MQHFDKELAKIRQEVKGNQADSDFPAEPVDSVPRPKTTQHEITHSIHGLSLTELNRVTKYVQHLRLAPESTKKTNRWRKWKPDDVSKLLEMASKYESLSETALEEMAKELGRTKAAIFCRLCAIGDQEEAMAVQESEIVKKTGVTKVQRLENAAKLRSKKQTPK